MANKTMKTLTIGNKTYEVVDSVARADIGTLNTKINTDIEILREEVDTDIETLREEVDTDIGALREEVNADINTLKEVDIKAINTDINALKGAVITDKTLSQSDKAADAKTVGDTISQLSTKIDNSIKSVSVRLPMDGWQSTEGTVLADLYSYTQNVTVEGVTANNIVLISAYYDDVQFFSECGIICINQGDNSLVFKCDFIPSEDVFANVVIMQ